jgi:hypothetical protein
MRNGVVYELPMQMHPITVSESSLLRSPKASEGEGGALGEAEALKRGNTVGVRDQVMDLVSGQGLKVSRVADNLLPTPNTMEHREIKTSEQIAELKELSPGGYRNLREVVINELPDALLPTPAIGHIRNYDEPIEDYLGRRQDYLDGKTKGMPGVSLGVAVRMEMLPTPIVRDYKDGQAPSMRDGKVSVDTVGRAIMNSGEVNLLPTLRASDGYERRNQKTMDKIAAEGGDLTMPTLARTTVSWGKFAPAIERWEAVTRPAPAPTKPDGKDGNHRLSAEFTEWMMGLPAGWVTDPEMGLKRNDQLKACGNGVVPQQAELALRVLLDGVEWNK